MSQSLSKLHLHLIFRVKKKSVHIKPQDSPDFFAYIGSIIKANGSIPIVINGPGDHIHILCVMSKNISLAKLVEEINHHSSRWIKTRGLHYQNFAWQGGYDGFSVSPSIHDQVKRYIQNQLEHHRKKTFTEELVEFLVKHNIEYNEQYLWTD